MSDNVFSARAVAWLIGIGVACFIGMIVLINLGEELFPTQTVQPTTYSKSAVGHQAWVRLMQTMGRTVLVSRNDSLGKAWDGVLILAEPNPFEDERAPIDDLLAADRVLLVLPKWYAGRSLVGPDWAGHADTLEPFVVNKALRLVTETGTVLQLETPPRWLPSDFGPAPELHRPQVILGSDLRPLIASKTGILLGEVATNDRTIWVLSDPDLISNHGIYRGANAQLAMAIVDRLRDGFGPIVIDETIHGYYLDPNLLKAMFQFPLIVVTVAGMAAILVLLWAATGRFGAPKRAEPALRMGKSTLVAAAADMLGFGGHDVAIADRYRRAVVEDVGRRIHAPLHGDEAALADWFDRVGRARGARRPFSQIWREFDVPLGGGNYQARLLLSAAQDLYRWKGEILNGTGADSRHR
jgi:hypothetical protein